jgi:hypothetical protein
MYCLGDRSRVDTGTMKWREEEEEEAATGGLYGEAVGDHLG